jgi:hypothetical protein
MTTYTISFYNVSGKNPALTRKVRQELKNLGNWMIDKNTAQRTTTDQGLSIQEIIEKHFGNLKSQFNVTRNLTITDENMNRFFYTNKGLI